jgi:hypothetical protein
MVNDMTIPQAIKLLFDIKISSESPFLKDKANSFVRNGLVKVRIENKVQRKGKYLADKHQLDVLFNALVLNAIFPDPKHVQRIFNDAGFRRTCTQTVKAVFGEHNSLAGQALMSAEVDKLISIMEGDDSLYQIRLPNPFTQLPQLAFGNNTGLLNVLLSQASSLNPIDSVIGTFIDGDFVKAQQLAVNMNEHTPGVKNIRLAIDQRLDVAIEFDELLDWFKKD